MKEEILPATKQILYISLTMRVVKSKLISVEKLTIDEDDIIHTTFYQGVYVNLEQSKEIISARISLQNN